MDGVDAVDSDDAWSDIIVYVTNKGMEKAISDQVLNVNFYDYLFLIRVAKVWEKCVEVEYLIFFHSIRAEINQAEFRNCGA